MYEKLEGMPAPNRLLYPFQFLDSWRFPHQPPRHRVAMTGRKLTKRQRQHFHRKVGFLLKNSSPVRERFQLSGYLGSWRNKSFLSLSTLHVQKIHASLHLNFTRETLRVTSASKYFSLCTPLKMMILLLQVNTLARCTLLARDARARRVTW